MSELKIYQYKNAYRYNSDTIFLYNFVQDCSGSLLEVGSGSGILGLLLKRDFPSLKLTQVEIQEVNVNLNIKNANINNLSSDIICENFLDYKTELKFDIIISNPPYFQANLQRSQNLHLDISKNNQSLPLESFIKKSNSLLKPKGRLIFCYEASQISKIIYLLQKYKLNLEKICFVFAKKDKNSHIILLEAKKSSKNLAKILPPIYVNGKNNQFSKMAQKIYKKANTKSYEWHSL